MKKLKNLFLCLFSIVFLLEFIALPTSAASGKVYIFTFVYTFNNKYTNSRDAASPTVLQHLWNMGYDAGEYLNNSAGDAYSVLPNSKISVIVSHAAPGLILMGKDGDFSLLQGDNEGKYVYKNDRFIQNYPSKALSSSNLVMYVGCRTGVNPDPVPDSSQVTGYRYPANLVTRTYVKGAKCAVGWNEGIEVDSTHTWVRLFFEKCDQAHEEIWECFNHADYWVKDIYGNVDWEKLNNRYEKGDIHQRLYQ